MCKNPEDIFSQDAGDTFNPLVAFLCLPFYDTMSVLCLITKMKIG